jgi:hypothetical protein
LVSDLWLLSSNRTSYIFVFVTFKVIKIQEKKVGYTPLLQEREPILINTIPYPGGDRPGPHINKNGE